MFVFSERFCRLNIFRFLDKYWRRNVHSSHGSCLFSAETVAASDPDAPTVTQECCGRSCSFTELGSYCAIKPNMHDMLRSDILRYINQGSDVRKWPGLSIFSSKIFCQRKHFSYLQALIQCHLIFQIHSTIILQYHAQYWKYRTET